jgi:protein TonB
MRSLSGKAEACAETFGLDAARVSTARTRFAAGYGRRVPCLMAVVALHVLLFALFLSHRRAASPSTPAVSIRARIVTEPRTIEPPPPLKPVTLKRPSMQIVVPAPIVAIAEPAAPAPAPRSVKVPAAAARLAPAPAPVSPPRFDAAYLRNPAPVYPLRARRMHEQGTVLLRVEVSAAGEALQVIVERGSGWPLLDKAALTAVRQWRFEPARRGSEPVAAWVLVPIEFGIRRG